MRILLRVLTAVAIVQLYGCSEKRPAVLFPQGPVALATRDLLFTAAGLMLIVVVPVFVLTAFVVWRYRVVTVGPSSKLKHGWRTSCGPFTTFVPTRQSSMGRRATTFWGPISRASFAWLNRCALSV